MRRPIASASRRRARSVRRPPHVGLLIAGLLVSLFLAFVVSPFASSSPDGLEKVAADKAIDRDEQDHDLADGPLADYCGPRASTTSGSAPAWPASSAWR